MIEIISGRKGKGKTKNLLDKVNGAVKEAHGDIVYLDKNGKHMYDLSNKVRLVDMSVYPIRNYDTFFGFLCGMVSQNHDLEAVYLDSFLKLSSLEGKDIASAVSDLDAISKKFSVNFVLSVSEDDANLPEIAREKTVLAL